MELRNDPLRHVAVLVHGLNVLAAFVGLSALVAVFIAYIKRDEARGTLWEGHFTYAIRTFWIGFAAALVSIVLTFVFVGILGLILLALWWLVRSIVGLLKAMDGKPIPDPAGLWIG